MPMEPFLLRPCAACAAHPTSHSSTYLSSLVVPTSLPSIPLSSPFHPPLFPSPPLSPPQDLPLFASDGSHISPTNGQLVQPGELAVDSSISAMLVPTAGGAGGSAGQRRGRDGEGWGRGGGGGTGGGGEGRELKRWVPEGPDRADLRLEGGILEMGPSSSR